MEHACGFDRSQLYSDEWPPIDEVGLAASRNVAKSRARLLPLDLTLQRLAPIDKAGRKVHRGFEGAEFVPRLAWRVLRFLPSESRARTMRFSISFLVAAFSAALLAACGGSNGFSSSMPVSVAPQIGTPRSSVSLPALHHAVSGTNLYVANSYDGSYPGTITIYASGGKKPLQTISQDINDPGALAFDSSGNLYVANLFDNTVTAYASGGSSPMLTISKDVVRPDALAFDSSRNLYVADYLNESGKGKSEFGHKVTVYAPGSTKVLRTITKGVLGPDALAFDGLGNLYVANADVREGAGTVTVYGRDSTKLLRTITKGMRSPTALAFDAAGNLYVANEGSDSGVYAVEVYAAGSAKILRTISIGVDGAEAWCLTAPAISTSKTLGITP